MLTFCTVLFLCWVQEQNINKSAIFTTIAMECFHWLEHDDPDGAVADVSGSGLGGCAD